MVRFRSVMLVGAIVVATIGAGPAPADETTPSRVEIGVLDAAVPQDVLIRFEQRVPTDIRSIPGLKVNYVFESLPAVFANGTPAALRQLAARDDLAFLEADKPIEFDLDTATVASRSKDVTHPDFDTETEPLLGPDGETIDGSGVGIAIIDTGLDGLHPDYQAPGKVAGNFYMTPAGPVPSPWTSNTYTDSGHGTHVAGIAAGLGTLSADQGGPVYEGVAPGASLYTFDVFYGAVSAAAMAFDWIIQHGHEQNPPIRVVNNSWHCGGITCRDPTDGQLLHVKAATRLAEAGYVVTWAAGNDIGDGWNSTINIEAINPTPGIISVANYKDGNTGRRDLCLSSNSSWGSSGDPATWPDVSAPGRSIFSTWAFGVDRTGTAGLDYRDPVTNANAYKEMSGTSMAAPHVAGIVALLLQLDPDLEPAEIEYILKQTSTPLVGTLQEPGCGVPSYRADAAHPWHASNYIAGHGLVHAYDAVVLAEGFGEIPAPVATEELPEDFIIVRPGVEVEHTFYFAGEDRLQTAYPDAPAPRVRPMLPNSGSLRFTSDPLTETITAEVVKIDVYLGTMAEAFASIAGPRIQATVEVITPSGTTAIAYADSSPWQIYPGLPNQRDFKVELDAPVTLAPGDKVSVVIEVASPPVSGIDPPPQATWDLWWERPFTSRVGFGMVDPRPAPSSRAGCESRQDCAMIDADHEFENMDCGGTFYDLSWYGPPGSALIFSCETAHTACVVPGVPGDPWGSCEAEFDATVLRVYKAGVCTYRMPDGTRGGTGRCVGKVVVEDDD